MAVPGERGMWVCAGFIGGGGGGQHPCRNTCRS